MVDGGHHRLRRTSAKTCHQMKSSRIDLRRLGAGSRHCGASRSGMALSGDARASSGHARAAIIVSCAFSYRGQRGGSRNCHQTSRRHQTHRAPPSSCVSAITLTAICASRRAHRCRVHAAPRASRRPRLPHTNSADGNASPFMDDQVFGCLHDASHRLGLGVL